MSKQIQDSIQIVEVGLRDGLQNEKAIVSTEHRVKLAEHFLQAGVSRLELGAFVRADWVPQMAGSKEVIQQVLGTYQSLGNRSSTVFSALVPNRHGMEEALQAGIQEVAIFASATESFSHKNINCSIDESFQRFADVLKLARQNRVQVRGYLSTCFGCPFEGSVDEARVVELAQRLIDIGCFEVSISDTIGVAHPAQVESLFTKLNHRIPFTKLAGHFHDTRGTALANILAAYRLGIRIFDSSLGGLGGCPYAPGAAGNVATEDVVYMFEGMDVTTGLDLPKLIAANHWMSQVMGKELSSKVAKAGLPIPQGPVSSATQKSS